MESATGRHIWLNRHTCLMNPSVLTVAERPNLAERADETTAATFP
jgi:hypothetical protein